MGEKGIRPFSPSCCSSETKLSTNRNVGFSGGGTVRPLTNYTTLIREERSLTGAILHCGIRGN
jgi:hypothetical protein